MSYPLQWNATRENGLRVLNSPTDPIHGLSSLLLFSDGSEWDVINIGFRKSASVYLNNTFNRGYSDGVIRTLIRRNNSTDQGHAWGGIFFVSDREGIGTLSSPGQRRYEVTDKGGFLKIIKYSIGVPTTLYTSSFAFSPNIIYGFQVRWKYFSLLNDLNIEVSLGTSVDFSDLVLLFDYTDSNSPYHLGVTEGLFVQTLSDTDVVSYTFDATSIYESSHL